MLAPSTKKLPCNHIFHKSCLRSWFQRQQTCPTCRLDVLTAPLPNQVNARVAGLAAAVAAAAQRGQQAAHGARDQPQQGAAGQAVPPHPNPFAVGPGGQAIPPNFPPFNPHMFAQFMNNLGVPPPRLHANQPTTHATSTTTVNGTQTSLAGVTSVVTSTADSAAQNQTGATAQGVRPNLPQFMAPPMLGIPPFPFSIPPFGVPPPMPPPNFSGLTTEELRAMEGNERENIEARVKCLRNVQVLLDAAVMEMQQYTLVASRLNSNAQTFFN